MVSIGGSAVVGAARPLGETLSVARLQLDEKPGGATIGDEARSRRPTSLRRFGEVIPGRLRPRSACVRFASHGDHATFRSGIQFLC